MAVELKEHVELRGDNPLDAVIEGTNVAAYLVALRAIQDSAQIAAEHYQFSLATVHAAIAFYYDNEQAIQQADEVELQKLWDMGMKSPKSGS